MKQFRYIPGVASLCLDQDRCIGCRMCSRVCPQTVFGYRDNKAQINDLDGCMECGACSINCPEEAISLNPGVG